MDFLELPWDQVKPLLLTLCNSLIVRFCLSMLYTLLTHPGRSREREVGSREHWLLTILAACLVLSCGQLQAFRKPQVTTT
jgi:hypothetical protein